eukprot:CCRYP_001050-RA/>CCRYP_001050-RA protein AED:0.03 eAED:0.03 QI:167/1/1/1/0.66/0.5/4/169/866
MSNNIKSPRRSSSNISSLQSLMESTAYNPSQKPIFDTSSSSNDNSSSSESEDMTTTHPPSTHPPKQSSSSNRDEFLRALVRITSGRFLGQTGRIERIIPTGWIYIYGNPQIDRPVRWGDVEVLHDGPPDTAVEEERDVSASYVDDDKHDPDDETWTEKPSARTMPDLMGARIRVVDEPHAGLEGTIVEKLNGGIYFQLDVLPRKIVRLEEVAIVSLPLSSAQSQSLQQHVDPITKYTGATVRVHQDGVQGKVEKVIVGELYITDNSEIQNVYQRNQFVVLKYADGTVPNKEENLVHCEEGGRKTGHAFVMQDSFLSRKRARISKEKDGDNQSSLSANAMNYPDVDGYSTDEIEDDNREHTLPIMNDEEDSHSTSANNNRATLPQYKKKNPLLGLTVRVIDGKGVGHIGRITKVCSRGWWELEGLDVKVKSNIVHFLDDGTFDYEAIRQYYSKNQRGTRMPAVVKVDDVRKEKKGGIGRHGEDGIRRVDKHREVVPQTHDGVSESDDESLVTKKRHTRTPKENGANLTVSRLSSGDLKMAKGKRMSERDSIMQWGRKSATSLAMSTIPDLEDDPAPTHRLKNRGSSVPVLDPILINTTGGHLGRHGTKNHSVPLLPEGLRHLPLDAKIEIFNRRTGRIMRGEDAVSLKDLPAALMEHAEYEPIVPPPPNTDILHRIGRSGRNIRISKSVVPQCRVRASAVEGKHVLVIGGEYRGLSGIVDSTLPGGWYVISNLFKHDHLSLDVIVSSNNLELMPDKISWSQSRLPGDDTIKTRVRLQASKLRLDALNEEKEKVLRSAATSNKAAADTNLMRLQSEISKVEAAIDRHQKDLLEQSEPSRLKDSGLEEAREPHTIPIAANSPTRLDTGH